MSGQIHNLSTTTDDNDALDLEMLTMAVCEARKCSPKETAFSVGCVLVARYPDDTEKPRVIATGYSRELEGNTHAEANALQKARNLQVNDLRKWFPSADENVSLEGILRRTTVYTTMEPCSVRTSGLAPCADALIAAGVPRCVIGVGEPDDFVRCEGAQKLAQAGVEVVWLKGLEDLCLSVARAGHDVKT